MRAIFSINQLIFPEIWGSGCRNRPAASPPETMHGQRRSVGPSRYLRFWLKYWGFVKGQPFGAGMKDPRAMPSVAPPAPATCMCCWYQQHYNPTRPAGLAGLGRYVRLILAARLFPPLKPDEIDGMCLAHIELLYPPRRGRVIGQSSNALAAAGDGAPQEEVGA